MLLRSTIVPTFLLAAFLFQPASVSAQSNDASEMSAALRDDQKTKLATLCEVMKDGELGSFRIIGHTDASGSAGYNEKLSLLRAQEVKRFLTGDCGVAEDRLDAVGVGEAFPLDKQDPRGDVNRRVEFQALS